MNEEIQNYVNKAEQTAYVALDLLNYETDYYQSNLIIELLDTSTMILMSVGKNLYKISFTKWHDEKGFKDLDEINSVFKTFILSREIIKYMLKVAAKHMRKISIQTGLVTENFQQQPAILYWI